MVTHLLILAIVSMAAGLLSGATKLAMRPLKRGFLRDGMGPSLCLLLLLMLTIPSIGFYVLFEAGLLQDAPIVGATLTAAAALIVSFVMEVVIERLHELQELREATALA